MSAKARIPGMKHRGWYEFGEDKSAPEFVGETLDKLELHKVMFEELYNAGE